MLIPNLVLLVGCVAALKSRTISGIANKQAPGADKYPPHTIDQPIDHFPTSSKYAPHTKATFKQRYIFDASYYKPGGPVYLFMSGENSYLGATYLFQDGLLGLLMKATNGIGILLENRYYGESFPFNSSSTDELTYLSSDQTIADNAYFAQHVKLPGFNSSINAPKTPWIMYGVSLAGAQVAYSIKAHGDVLYGGIGSSAAILAAHEYPEWYKPIQKFGPSDCIASINEIIANFDKLVDSKNKAAIQEFKNFFGLGELTDVRDFAQTIAFPLGGPLFYPTRSWQELDWFPKFLTEDFWLFCKNVTNPDAPANIKQVDYALSRYTNGKPWTNLGNYANYIQKYIVPTCDGAPIDSSACFSTQNGKPPYQIFQHRYTLKICISETHYAETTNNGDRSYLYQTCTEMGWYQVAPKSGPALISKVLQVDYTQQWCTWAFPPGKYNKIPTTPDTDSMNKYGGLNVSADRLAFIDGGIDPWRDLTYHSDNAPARVRNGVEDEILHPQYLIHGAAHGWEATAFSYEKINEEPQFIREAHLWEIRIVKKWLSMFKETKGFGKD
ncbi:hypothetical protein FKW77_005077 [Venturia effusa]|uniref:Extracelular serine carboxypeptidase n=1 Tax=Venturia effusa TaxID=50376 RepID=A0A517LH54_9PEZI|nr:hypothetical protein FKW77_005077 [Venturia effusa]